MNESAFLTRTEELTLQFYEWEKRGRGWYLWDYAVDLEPPFEPFYKRQPAYAPGYDDTRKPTIFSSFFDRIFGRATPDKNTHWRSEASFPRKPRHHDSSSPLIESQVTFPRGRSVSQEVTKQFLQSLPRLASPLSFEIVGTGENIRIVLTCGTYDAAPVIGQFMSFFPDAVITSNPQPLEQLWFSRDDRQAAIIEFGLTDEFMLPIRIFKNFDIDPIVGVTGALSHLKAHDIGILQVLFKPVRNNWADSILQSVFDRDGTPFFVDAPELVTAAKRKVSSPLYSVVIRAASRSASTKRTWKILAAIAGALNQFAQPRENAFIPLSNDGYDDTEHETDLLLRRTHRSGMILSCEEMIGLVHIPSESVRSPKLVREIRKTKKAPDIAFGHPLILGENFIAGIPTPVSLGADQRVQHMHVIGASGTGKSHFLINLITQDILNGEGIAVFDPHGDLIDDIIPHVPENRIEDVILFDPSDEAFPISFNILSAHSEIEKQLIASDLVAVFRRLSTSWGDQMNSVLSNAVLAFLESSKGGTLSDMRRFLVESDFRNDFLKTVDEPDIFYYWNKEFPLLTGRPQAPILTRLDTFLRPRLIRNMVAQQESRLDFAQIMNGSKIFLARLAHGAIGEENAYLLGTLLVSKLYQLAIARQDKKITERRPFFVYIDEFQNFITPSLSTILSGARKFGLGLTLAHQDLGQIHDPILLSAILTNSYTRICFRVGDSDALKMSSGFSFFDAKDLQSLGLGEAIARVERAEYDFNLTTLPRSRFILDLAEHKLEQILTQTRTTYALPKEHVEESLRQNTNFERPASSRINRAERHIPQYRKEPLDMPKETPVQNPERSNVTLPPIPIPPLGRGGRQHKYLQGLIKRWGESNGYRTTIEQSILDGHGNVDVTLEREDGKIACEITITTTIEHEWENIQKCLTAGFNDVVLISIDQNVLDKATTQLLPQIEETYRDRVHFFTPENLFSWAHKKASLFTENASVIGGYNVEVHIKNSSNEDQQVRHQTLSTVMLEALRRLRDIQ